MAAFTAVLDQAPADAYRPAQEQLDSIITHLRLAKRMRHSDLEEYLHEEGREILRRLMQAYLEECGPGKVSEEVIDAKGVRHTHQRLNSRSLTTIFGEVEVERQGYGGRGLESLHPLDAELNLPPEEYSHTLQRRIGEAAAKESFDEVVTTLQAQTGVKVPKRQVEESARRASEDFEKFYKQRRSATEREARASGEILAVTVDGKGVPMRSADLREATRKAAARREPRLTHGGQEKRAHAKRMGTVAAVYTIERYARTPEQIVRELGPVHDPLPPRPRPEDKRVWASVIHSPETVVTQVFEEALRRDPERTKEWVGLVDGNEKQLDLLMLAAEENRVNLTIILDLIHVLEYLWKACWAFHERGDRAAQQWVSERLLEILRGRSSLVAAGMRRSATRRGLEEKTREPVDDCANYLLKYRVFLRYDQYLARGYPIATGVIEGACRYLVKDRMEITGARWSLEGAEAILQLRSLHASGDFDEYWDFHLLQEYQRHHASNYSQGIPPRPVEPPQRKKKSRRLRVVE